MTGRFFSGNESWVFQADHVEELSGHHAALVGQALHADERPRLLVYSPRREVGAAPFGLQVHCGSHALALTDRRLIISRDPHRLGCAPGVVAVPLGNVLALEIGEALTLGWLLVGSRQGDGVRRDSIFFPSTGIGLFHLAVRALRAGASQNRSHGVGEAWWPATATIPPYLLSQMAPLISTHERLLGLVVGQETWRTGRRARPVCSAVSTLCVVTDRGVLVAGSEPPPERGALAFAVNVTSVARSAIQRAVVSCDGGSPPITTLVLALQNGAAVDTLEFAIGGRRAPDVEEVIAHLGLPTAGN